MQENAKHVWWKHSPVINICRRGKRVTSRSVFRPRSAVSHFLEWTLGEGYAVHFLSKVIVHESNIAFLRNSMNQKFTRVTFANNYSQIQFLLQGFTHMHRFDSVTSHRAKKINKINPTRWQNGCFLQPITNMRCVRQFTQHTRVCFGSAPIIKRKI